MASAVIAKVRQLMIIREFGCKDASIIHRSIGCHRRLDGHHGRNRIKVFLSTRQNAKVSGSNTKPHGMDQKFTAIQTLPNPSASFRSLGQKPTAFIQRP
jgi:hypothetical protein